MHENETVKGNNISCEFLYVGRSTFSPYSKLINPQCPVFAKLNKTAVFRLVATINCHSTETIEIRVETGMCSFWKQLTCHHITIVHI
jgi:hypothetical protein